MRLQDWNVQARFANMLEMNGPARIGQCTASHDSKRASILVIHPNEIPAQDDEATTEAILVHELCHLHTGPLREAVDELPEEQAVHAFTQALMNAYIGRK